MDGTVYILIDESQLSYGDKYRVFQNYEDVCREFKKLGGGSAFGLGAEISTERGHGTMYKAGLVDLMVIPVGLT